MNAPLCPRCVDHRTATFHVAEMDCAHEVAILEKRLASLTGVVTLDADVLSRQLRVHFDGAMLSAAGIAEAVAQTGMRAWPVTAGLGYGAEKFEAKPLAAPVQSARAAMV